MAEHKYSAGVLQGLKTESGGTAAVMRAFWPEAIDGKPRVPEYPAGPCEAECGPPPGYHAPTSQTYGGVRLCLHCANARARSGGPSLTRNTPDATEVKEPQEAA